MTSTLNVVVENAEVFAKILRNCGLSQVADWKLEDVTRAFNWAQYFQKVNQRIGSKTSVLNKLESRVKEIGWSLGMRFGQEELSFHFLANSSQQYCTQALLGNPVLPDQLRQYILSEHLNTLDPLDVNNELNQALFTTLTKVHGILKDYVADNDPTLSLHSLDAAYLREDISWLLQAGADSGTTRLERAEHTSSTAVSRLTSLAQVDGGMEVILLALLQSSAGGMLVTGPHPFDMLDSSRKFILEWLVEIAQSWNEIESRSISGSVPEHCSTSASGEEVGTSELGRVLWSGSHHSLLVRTSISFFSFFKEHLKFLVCKTEKLNAQLGAQSMCLKKTQQESTRELEWLASQWAELASRGTHIKDVCLPVIKSRAFPHLAVEDETWGAKNRLQQELCHAGYTLDYPPTENRVWTEVLRVTNVALKERH